MMLAHGHPWESPPTCKTEGREREGEREKTFPGTQGTFSYLSEVAPSDHSVLLGLSLIHI